jgi:hypothetical protein
MVVYIKCHISMPKNNCPAACHILTSGDTAGPSAPLTPKLLNALASVEMESPTMFHRERLKDEASASACGKEVGQMAGPEAAPPERHVYGINAHIIHNQPQSSHVLYTINHSLRTYYTINHCLRTYYTQSTTVFALP